MSSLFRVVVAFASCVAVVGCGLTSTPSPSVEEAVTYGACNPAPCVKLTFHDVDLPLNIPPSSVEAIRGQIQRALYTPVESLEGDFSKERLVKEVRAQFDEYLEVSDAAPSAEWTLARRASLLYDDEKVLSVMVKNEGYLGGAHGFSDITFLVFDVQTGRKLEWSDVVSDESRPVLLKASEAEFRRVREIPAGQSLSEAGFDFSPEGSFNLPANFAVSARGLHLHYNPYEVGPYVMGATDVIVPIEVFSGVARSDTAALEGVSGAKGALL